MKSLFKKIKRKLKYCLHHIKTKYIFVAFHFYFLLDLFQTAMLSGVAVFYFLSNGLARRKMSPPRIINPPKPCIVVSSSPSKIPHITATTGINKVTVDANKGVETLSKR